MIVRQYTTNDCAAWNSFVANAKNPHFFFQRSYMEYHEDRFEDFSLMFYDEKENLLAMLPATRQGNRIISHGGLTFGGFIIGERMTAELMLEAVESLKLYMLKTECKELIYKCIPYIYTKYPSEEDRYALFMNNAKLVRRDVSTTIFLPERYEYCRMRKRIIKKGEKYGVKVRESKDFESYIAMMNTILEDRHGTKAVHTGAELAMLADRFPENIHLYIGELDGKMEAGTVIFDNGSVVHTQYLANSDVGRTVGALDCVIDHLIKEVYADRTYFDFGISNEDNGRYLNEGLIAQKEGFGGRSVVHDFYRLTLT